MSKLELKDKWVLVTGASSGLGREIAWQLAAEHGANLVLAARRVELLTELATHIKSKTTQQAIVVPLDMEQVDNIESFVSEVLGLCPLFGVVLNAGITYFGQHTQASRKDIERLLRVNVLSTIEMFHLFYQHFTHQKTGSILVISSMSVHYPVPYQALYSGTKSAVFSFAYALSHEQLPRDCSLTIFTPGGIETEMTSSKSFDGLKSWLMPASEAAREAIYAMIHRKRVHTPGLLNRIGGYLMRLIPRDIIAAQMSRMYRKSLKI